MGFSKQECWSGLPFPPPGDLPDPGSNLRLMSPALAGGFIPTSTICAMKYSFYWKILMCLMENIANKGMSKAMVFPVVMYGCEIWTIKHVESQRIDAFELWCWRRLLRVPRTARRSNQSSPWGGKQLDMTE